MINKLNTRAIEVKKYQLNIKKVRICLHDMIEDDLRPSDTWKIHLAMKTKSDNKEIMIWNDTDEIERLFDSLLQR